MTQAKSMRAASIECNECKTQVKHEEVRACLEAHPEEFASYENLLINDSLNRTEECQFCPKGCGTPVFGDVDSPCIRCPNTQCGFVWCFRCKDEWHQGRTCEEQKKLKVQNSEVGVPGLTFLCPSLFVLSLLRSTPQRLLQ